MAKEKVKNLQVNKQGLEVVSNNIENTVLRPAQLFGKKLREVSASPEYRQYLYQKQLQNIRQEQEDWTEAMSSKTLYYN